MLKALITIVVIAFIVGFARHIFEILLRDRLARLAAEKPQKLVQLMIALFITAIGLVVAIQYIPPIEPHLVPAKLSVPLPQVLFDIILAKHGLGLSIVSVVLILMLSVSVRLHRLLLRTLFNKVSYDEAICEDLGYSRSLVIGLGLLVFEALSSITYLGLSSGFAVHFQSLSFAFCVILIGVQQSLLKSAVVMLRAGTALKPTQRFVLFRCVPIVFWIVVIWNLLSYNVTEI